MLSMEQDCTREVIDVDECTKLQHFSCRGVAYDIAQQSKKECDQRSVLVSAFDKKITADDLQNYFQKFDKVEKITFDKMKRFAVIQFYKNNKIPYIVKQTHLMGSNKLYVRPLLITHGHFAFASGNPTLSGEDSSAQLILLLSAASSICGQMELLVDQLQLTKESLKTRERLCSQLSKTFAKHFYQFELNMFGSCVTGLGFNTSDLDMVLTLFPDDDTELEREGCKELLPNAFNYLKSILLMNRKLTVGDLMTVPMIDILKNLKWQLQRSKIRFQNIFIIPAKVAPLIRFTTLDTRISCDLAVKNKLSLYNTNLIKFYVELDRRFLILMFTVRLWFKCQQLSGCGTHSLTSYALTMMTIFFLQNITPPVLPTVEELRNIERNDKVVGGWQCGFSEDINRICQQGINFRGADELLLEFIQYYANLEFDNYCICLNTGELCPKKDMQSVGPNFESIISIQDPFELSRNITFNMSQKIALSIIKEFQRAKQIVTIGNWQPKSDQPWGILLLIQKDGNLNNLHDILGPNNKKPKAKKNSEGAVVKFTIDIPDGCPLKQKLGVKCSKEALLEHLSNAVILILNSGLKFYCHKEDKTIQSGMTNPGTSNVRQNKRGHESDESPTKKFISSQDGEKVAKPIQVDKNQTQLPIMSNKCSLDKATDDAFNIIQCKIFHRTWVGRKKAAQQCEIDPTMSVIEREKCISQYLIKEEHSEKHLPFHKFDCKVMVHKVEDDFVASVHLIPISFSTELQATVFNFLSSYIPKIVSNYLLE